MKKISIIIICLLLGNGVFSKEDKFIKSLLRHKQYDVTRCICLPFYDSGIKKILVAPYESLLESYQMKNYSEKEFENYFQGKIETGDTIEMSKIGPTLLEHNVLLFDSAELHFKGRKVKDILFTYFENVGQNVYDEIDSFNYLESLYLVYYLYKEQITSSVFEISGKTKIWANTECSKYRDRKNSFSECLTKASTKGSWVYICLPYYDGAIKKLLVIPSFEMRKCAAAHGFDKKKYFKYISRKIKKHDTISSAMIDSGALRKYSVDFDKADNMFNSISAKEILMTYYTDNYSNLFSRNCYRGQTNDSELSLIYILYKEKVVLTMVNDFECFYTSFLGYSKFKHFKRPFILGVFDRPFSGYNICLPFIDHGERKILIVDNDQLQYSFETRGLSKAQYKDYIKLKITTNDTIDVSFLSDEFVQQSSISTSKANGYFKNQNIELLLTKYFRSLDARFENYRELDVHFESDEQKLALIYKLYKAHILTYYGHETGLNYTTNFSKRYQNYRNIDD